MWLLIVERVVKVHVVSWGDSEEEDFGFGRIDVEVDPPGPGGEAFVVSHVAVHVLHHSVAVLNVIPSANSSEKS